MTGGGGEGSERMEGLVSSRRLTKSHNKAVIE